MHIIRDKYELYAWLADPTAPTCAYYKYTYPQQPSLFGLRSQRKRTYGENDTITVASMLLVAANNLPFGFNAFPPVIYLTQKRDGNTYTYLATKSNLLQDAQYSRPNDDTVVVNVWKAIMANAHRFIYS